MAHEINKGNDLRFPDGSTVLVWYPPHGVDARDRSGWAWLPGAIVSHCCTDEWCIVVEAPELAEPDTSLPDGGAPENLLYPLCFRDSSESCLIALQTPSSATAFRVTCWYRSPIARCGRRRSPCCRRPGAPASRHCGRAFPTAKKPFRCRT